VICAASQDGGEACRGQQVARLQRQRAIEARLRGRQQAGGFECLAQGHVRGRELRLQFDDSFERRARLLRLLESQCEQAERVQATHVIGREVEAAPQARGRVQQLAIRFELQRDDIEQERMSRAGGERVVRARRCGVNARALQRVAHRAQRLDIGW